MYHRVDDGEIYDILQGYLDDFRKFVGGIAKKVF